MELICSNLRLAIKRNPYSIFRVSNRFLSNIPEGSVSSKEIQTEINPLSVQDYFRVQSLYTVKDLFDARVHLGHTPRTLTDSMKQFIYGQRFDTSIIDLDQTNEHMRKALNFLSHVALRGGIILFVCRQPQFIHMTEKAAIECGEYAHCRAWSHRLFSSPKKTYGSEVRLPDVVVLLHTKDGTLYNDHGAIIDSAKESIPTVGIVDTDCNSNLITYPIPGNDDTYDSIKLYLDLFTKAILLGKEERTRRKSAST